MRAKPFFKTRFVVRPGLESQGDHWLGGKGDYRTPKCPACGGDLFLIFDFNCDDPILRKASRGKFGTLKRLPLFHCMRCLCELSYRVDDDLKVQVVHSKYGGREYSLPYEPYPEYFPRKAIALDSSVPPDLPSAIRKWDSDDTLGENLSAKDRAVLESYFGHPIFIPRFMYHHQLGGESLYESWDEKAFFCPNKKCPSGLWDKMLRRDRPMKFLAGVLNDPPGGLPLIEPLNDKTRKQWNYFVSFVFQICDKCLTITTYGSSD